MDLMMVKDVMLGKNGKTILTGPLLLESFSRRSEVEKAFGERVLVSNDAGKRLFVPVSGVSVSQAMSGNWQVSIAIDYPENMHKIALDSLVSS
ncbi:hypothetical protein [Gynuella sunshinyii]|uniref:hypothetical protein n=1 Tax=Gynuella sunshinyii TaxID=1445505 RepID=UPI0005CB881C|nr:hypothetical protein [Gynuella sunshinyii]